MGIPHRVHERAGQQVLTVENPAQVVDAQACYHRFMAGDIAPRARLANTSPVVAGPPWQMWLLRAPVTLILLLACLLGALVVASGNIELLSLLSFQSYFELGGARFHLDLPETLKTGQFWRLWTPIFLHFGILHLVFNSLWLWEFGRRIEYVQGHGRLLGLVLLIGLGSNYTQYIFAENRLFGGMSGVVYGLVGYCLGWSLVRPGQDFGVPRALIYAMIVLMLLALTGLFTLVGFGAAANAAHLSGFFIGLVAGLILALASPPDTSPDS